jgi:hypothetical protein
VGASDVDHRTLRGRRINGHAGQQPVNETNRQFPAACQRAIADARPNLFRPDWKSVFEPDGLRESVTKIVARG